jgi:hypothetical protein
MPSMPFVPLQDFRVQPAVDDLLSHWIAANERIHGWPLSQGLLVFEWQDR